MNRRKRTVSIVLGTLLLVSVIPVAGFAAGGTFTDDDTSIFEADIEWLASVGVTAGCNPPANDNFCPDENVKRGQMAAFMRRFADYLDVDGLASTINTGLQDVNTQLGDRYTKSESDARYVPQGDIVITHGPGAFGNPAAAVQVFGDAMRNSSGDGFANMPLTGPAQLGTVDYGLKSLTYCADITAPAYIDDVVVSATTGAPYTNVGAVSDLEDRTMTGCYTVTVSDTTGTSHIAAFDFSGGAGGSVTISSVTTTWAPKSAITEQQPSGSGDPANSAG